MSYRLKLREPLGKGIRRVGLDQLSMVEAKLRADSDVATAVHDARRCLKRLRALLRLVRPALDDKVYRAEGQRLAEVGRMLAGERDRFVMRQTLMRMETMFGALPGQSGEKLAALIAEGHDLTAPPDPISRRTALAKLKASRKFFSGHAFREVSMEHAIAGAEKVYRSARRAFETCKQEPSDEAFHTWRKSIQQHWRHMALLSRAWPDAMSARAQEAKTLSQILGDDHDLAVLVAFASQEEAQLPSEGLAELLANGKKMQADLRNLALLHAQRLLQERPKHLSSRIGAYWNAACGIAEVGDYPVPQAAQPASEPASEQGQVSPAKGEEPAREAEKKAPAPIVNGGARAKRGNGSKRAGT